MGGNFKVRCLKDGGYDSLYTVGKIYEVINGVFTFNNFETMNEIESVEDLSANTSAIWELVEDKSSDLRELIKPCMVVKMFNGDICSIGDTKKGLVLKWEDGIWCYLNKDGQYSNIIELYGLLPFGSNSHDYKIQFRPLIWKREEAQVKSPTELEIESIEEEQRKLADRLAKLKESL